MPRRVERNRTGPREVSRTATVIAQQQRAEHDQQQRRADDVERALQREVDALEDRRAELEQRHRLSRHELGALDQDLHRRRRQAHPHPAPVALVDQLHRIDLGEVRVGDDHLVDPLVRQHLAAGPPASPAERRPLARQRARREEADELDASSAARRASAWRRRRRACRGRPAPCGAGSRRRAAAPPWRAHSPRAGMRRKGSQTPASRRRGSSWRSVRR